MGLTERRPCEPKKIAEQIDAALALCRQLSVPVPLADIDGLFAFLRAQCRAISNSTYDLINLRGSPGLSFNLATYLADLSREVTSKKTLSINQDFFYSCRPENLTKHIHIHRPTTAFHIDVNHSYQVARTVRRARYEQNFPTEQNYHYTANRTNASEYILENADPTGAYRGGVVLKKDGVVVSTVQVVPDPLQNVGALPSADSIGIHWENPGSHTAAHGGSSGGSGGSGDGLIGSLDCLSDSGQIRAITTTGVTVTTSQTLDDRYINLSQYALEKAFSDGLHTLRAQQSAALEARIAASEAIPRLTMKFQGGSDLPVNQIQFKNGHFSGSAHYTGLNILYLQTSGPSDNNPY